MVLVGMLSGLSGLLKLKDATDIDSSVFKIHYKFTAAFLFAFCLMVTAKGLVGDPINCTGNHNPLPSDVLNSFCWIHTTFTLPGHQQQNKKKGNTMLFPGVGNDQEDDERIYHSYYQWVPFVLFFQGILFYAPHWLWRAWEGGKITVLVMGLSGPVLNKNEMRERIKILADYLHSTLHLHNVYTFKYFVCEALNLINVVSCFCLLGKLLGGMFLNFGTEVINFLQIEDSQRTDPLMELFPRVTKCKFRGFGLGGGLENFDFICILPLNILNEKIFIFLWFWFVLLITVSSLAIIYQLLVLSLPALRISVLYRRSRPRFNGFAKNMSKRLQMGDWFVLNLLSKNMDFTAFQALMEEFYINLEPKESMPDIEMTQQRLYAKETWNS